MRRASLLLKTLSEWRLFTFLVAAQLLMVAGITIFDRSVDGLRNVVLSTTCYAFFPFCLVFSASAVQLLRPNELFRWSLQNRRFIGLSFAVEQTVHVTAVIVFALLAPAVYANESTIFSQLLGVIAYLFALAMGATSFSSTRARLGLVRWNLLHKTGVYFIWIAYAWIFGKRLIKHPSAPLYILAMALLLSCLTLRFLGYKAMQRRVAHAFR